MEFMSIFLIVPTAAFDDGGFCTNSSNTRCTFGCCGDVTNQTCCIPIGVLIGCTCGLLGSICMLVTLLRCRTGNQNRERAQSDISNHANSHHHNGEVAVFPNPAFTVDVRDTPPDNIARGTACLKCSYSAPPPSYEECMAEIANSNDRAYTQPENDCRMLNERGSINENRLNTPREELLSCAT